MITYPAFLALSLASLVLVPAHPSVALAAGLAGFACLISVDRIYAAMAREGRARIDDVTATLSATFLAGTAAGVPWVAVPTGAARLLGFVWRRSCRRDGQRQRWSHPLVAGRVGIGLALPLALWVSGGAAAWPWVVGCAVAGEALDRADFYDALDVTTPQARMVRDTGAAIVSDWGSADT